MLLLPERRGRKGRTRKVKSAKREVCGGNSVGLWKNSAFNGAETRRRLARQRGTDERVTPSSADLRSVGAYLRCHEGGNEIITRTTPFLIFTPINICIIYTTSFVRKVLNWEFVFFQSKGGTSYTLENYVWRAVGNNAKSVVDHAPNMFLASTADVSTPDNDCGDIIYIRFHWLTVIKGHIRNSEKFPGHIKN